MKKLIIPLMLLSAAAYADDQNNLDTNNQNNNSTTNSSGSLQNYQINNQNDARHRIGDVECAAPTVSAGLTAREGSSNAMAYTSISFPLGGSTCKKAQQSRLKRMEYDLRIAGVEQKKRDIIFKERLTMICDKLNGSKHHMLLAECHGDPEGQHGG